LFAVQAQEIWVLQPLVYVAKWRETYGHGGLLKGTLACDDTALLTLA
jgi:hypothetical protein